MELGNADPAKSSKGHSEGDEKTEEMTGTSSSATPDWLDVERTRVFPGSTLGVLWWSNGVHLVMLALWCVLPCMYAVLRLQYSVHGECSTIIVAHVSLVLLVERSKGKKKKRCTRTRTSIIQRLQMAPQGAGVHRSASVLE